MSREEINKTNVIFCEHKIEDELNKLPPHDRFLSCDGFGNLCKEICEKYNLFLSVMDMMKLWERFQNKDWDFSDWRDAEGKCSCDRCQKYKKEWIEERISFLRKYPDTFTREVYEERCKEVGIEPIEIER